MIQLQGCQTRMRALALTVMQTVLYKQQGIESRGGIYNCANCPIEITTGIVPCSPAYCSMRRVAARMER